MKRRYRLRKNADFQRVRRFGQSEANKFVVLIKLPNTLNHSRFGFAVSKRIGKAVVRNKTKRRMREATRLQLLEIETGWDVLFIARKPIAQANYQEIAQAITQLLKRANLLISVDTASAGNTAHSDLPSKTV